MIQNLFKDIYIQESYVGTEPISLADAKAQCRVDFDDDDALITALITAARQTIENFCHISLVPKTITLAVESKESLQTMFMQPYQVREEFAVFELPQGPVSSVDSVTSIDSDLVSILVCELNSDYFLRGTAFQSIMIRSNFNNSIIVYRTGYETLPGALRLAILNEIAFRYEHRGDESSLARGGTSGLPGTVEVGLCLASQVLATPYIRMTNI